MADISKASAPSGDGDKTASSEEKKVSIAKSSSSSRASSSSNPSATSSGTESGPTGPTSSGSREGESSVPPPKGKRWRWKFHLFWVSLVVLLFFAVSFYWGQEPELFDVTAAARKRAEAHQQLGDGQMVRGYVTVATLAEISERMLSKPGGYLTNDKILPSVLMDNIPSWEFGVLHQVRDFSLALRNDLTRSRTQSVEDVDLAQAHPRFNFDNNSWIFPPTETEYRKGVEYLESYLKRLTDSDPEDGQFFARADNLVDWLKLVEKRLGSLSQRLSASVGQSRVNTDLAGESNAQQAKPASGNTSVKTPWMEIDDVFYEARGTTWALVHLCKAIEIDFREVLENKNAVVSFRQIIRELESTQGTIWSPVILNGSQFGMFANHSLVMSSYISRANAALLDLRNLLEQG